MVVRGCILPFYTEWFLCWERKIIRLFCSLGVRENIFLLIFAVTFPCEFPSERPIQLSFFVYFCYSCLQRSLALYFAYFYGKTTFQGYLIYVHERLETGREYVLISKGWWSLKTQTTLKSLILCLCQELQATYRNRFTQFSFLFLPTLWYYHRQD